LGLPGLSTKIEESIAHAILLDENLLLLEQNNKNTTRNSIKATVVGSARVLSYEDIVKAQKKCDGKEAGAEAVRGRHESSPTQVIRKRSRVQELEEAENEIRALGMESYCSVLRF
jgi:hypothetical protein